MRTFKIRVTMPNGEVKSEVAYTEDYALNKAKFLAKQGKEVEVRDDKYGLLFFSQGVLMDTIPMLDRENGTIYIPTRQKGVSMERQFPELFNPLG